MEPFYRGGSVETFRRGGFTTPSTDGGSVSPGRSGSTSPPSSSNDSLARRQVARETRRASAPHAYHSIGFKSAPYSFHNKKDDRYRSAAAKERVHVLTSPTALLNENSDYVTRTRSHFDERSMVEVARGIRFVRTYEVHQSPPKYLKYEHRSLCCESYLFAWPFAMQSGDIPSDLTLDLQGMNVEMAVLDDKRAISVVAKYQPSITLMVISGRERNSLQGVSKIRRALNCFLTLFGLSYT